MSVYKCDEPGCYAQVDQRGATCGGHDDNPAETRIVIPEHITTKETDRRGRITLGKEFANRRVTVAVVKSETLNSGEEASAADAMDDAGSPYSPTDPRDPN